MPDPFDLFSPEALANPFPVYERMRRDAPVFKGTHPLLLAPTWLISRYNDVVAVLRDTETFSSNPRKLTPEQLQSFAPFFATQLRVIQDNMLGVDPPDHSRLRSLAAKAFTPRRIENLRPLVVEIVRGLLDRAAERGGMDIVADFSYPIQSTVIAELLGLPMEDRTQFQELIDTMATPPTPENRQRMDRIIDFFVDYFQELFRKRRIEPQNDLISALALAEEAGDRLSSQELLNTVFLLLVAGHETTFNLLNNSVLALLQHPEQLAKLRANPALIGSATEEMLRYTGPLVTAGPRFALRDIELRGQPISAGDMVATMHMSANFDPEQFDRPEVFDITRSPNRHVAFGSGIHFCIGAPLARLDVSVAIPMLIERFPHLRLAVDPDQIERHPLANIRSLVHLPVEV